MHESIRLYAIFEAVFWREGRISAGVSPTRFPDTLITMYRYGNASVESVINQRITRMNVSDKYLVIELRK